MLDLCPHDLRKTAASIAVQHGTSLSVIAACLGHADQRTTEAHYAHLSDDSQRSMLTSNAERILAAELWTDPRSSP
jgi:integrase